MLNYGPVGGANAEQVGGDHYKGKSKSGQNHWDMAWDFGLDFYQYQLTKYIMRHKHKGGIQDLQKAGHFLRKYIEVLEGEQAAGKLEGGTHPVERPEYKR